MAALCTECPPIQGRSQPLQEISATTGMRGGSRHVSQMAPTEQISHASEHPWIGFRSPWEGRPCGARIVMGQPNTFEAAPVDSDHLAGCSIALSDEWRQCLVRSSLKTVGERVCRRCAAVRHSSPRACGADTQGNTSPSTRVDVPFDEGG
jgi:hypothetical protein